VPRLFPDARNTDAKIKTSCDGNIPPIRQEYLREVGDCRESVANPLATRPTCGYTLGMKTAVSIPNDLFEGAERLARRTRRSRSRLFSDALREYLAHHTPDNVTELMDKALGQIGAGKDTFVSSAGKRTLFEIEW